MRSWTLVLVASLLAVPTLPVTAETSCPCTVTDTYSVSGDTVVFALEVGAGGAEVLAGSTVALEAQYATPREDLATGVAITGGFGHAVAVLYARAQTPSQTLVSVGGDGALASQGIELFGPPSSIGGASVTWIFDGSQLSQGRWVFTLSFPEAASLSVDIDLTFDSDVSYERGPATSTGLLAAPDDQTGGAQIIHGNASAAVAHGATGQAPDGTRGYGLMFGDDRSNVTGVYGIDGPGSADHTVAALGGAPPTAFVVGGPGAYAFDQDVVVSREARFPGPVAVFFASPVSF